MAILLQVLPFVAAVAVAVGLLVLLNRTIGRRTTPERPREDPSLQHHQQSVRSQIGGGGTGL